MKTSNFIILLIIGVIFFTTFKIIKIENMSLNESFGNNMYSMSDTNALHSFAQNIKTEKKKNVLFVSVPIIFILLVTYSVTRKNEIKNDPIKNLENLKSNSIISNEEFKMKKEQFNEIIVSKKEIRETQKLVDNLENLKSKGLLSQQEFDEKMKLLKQK